MGEIREHAEQILFGDTLQDKLAPISNATDLEPGHVLKSPELPGRPAELSFAGTGKRAPFPRPGQLNTEKQRALVLHHFANHELLALELMALTLLRFPNAPPSFRRGLIQTMADEQTHLTLYEKRMSELGIQLGDAPVNRFFWDALGVRNDGNHMKNKRPRAGGTCSRGHRRSAAPR